MISSKIPTRRNSEYAVHTSTTSRRLNCLTTVTPPRLTTATPPPKSIEQVHVRHGNARAVLHKLRVDVGQLRWIQPVHFCSGHRRCCVLVGLVNYAIRSRRLQQQRKPASLNPATLSTAALLFEPASLEFNRCLIVLFFQRSEHRGQNAAGHSCGCSELFVQSCSHSGPIMTLGGRATHPTFSFLICNHNMGVRLTPPFVIACHN
jgi:hypothetical protein